MTQTIEKSPEINTSADAVLAFVKIRQEHDIQNLGTFKNTPELSSHDPMAPVVSIDIRSQNDGKDAPREKLFRQTPVGKAAVKITAIAAGVTAAVSLSLFKESNENVAPAMVDGYALTAEQRPATIAQKALDAEAVTDPDIVIADETNESLRSGGYNCGHTLDDQTGEAYDYSNQINYLNENVELANKSVDWQINDAEWGMGQAAWDVLMNRAIKNTNTPEDAVVNANENTNAYAHFMQTVRLESAGTYVNFTCSDSAGNVEIREVQTMKLTENVNGFVVDAEGLDEFNKAVRKGKDGLSMFDIVELKDFEVNDDDYDKGVKYYLIVTESTGCLNPNRVPSSKKKETIIITTTTGTTYETTGSTTTTIPETTTTTIPETTTTTIPEETTTTTIPETTTTTTTTTLPIHPPADGPPEGAEIPPQDQPGTPGYEPGNAEEVVEQQENETPGGVDPTEYGTPAPDGSPSGDDQVVSEPGEEAPDNPEYNPEETSPGTDEGVNNGHDIESEDDKDANPTETPLPFDPMSLMIGTSALGLVGVGEEQRRKSWLSQPNGLRRISNIPGLDDEESTEN